MCKTIGILGGMGPYATIDLFQKIVVNTPARSDQEHLRIIIYNNPKIPPRTLASSPYPKNPLPELVKSAITLEQAGADFIIMPCHTAHIWLHDIKRAVTIPFYSLIENTVQTMIQQKCHTDKKILLLATQMTIKHQLYQQAFSNCPFELVIPSVEEQKVVDSIIAYVKAGNLTTNPYMKDVNRILKQYKQKGISMLLGGCTEIPLLFPHFDINMEMIDPTLMLAKMAILKAS